MTVHHQNLHSSGGTRVARHAAQYGHSGLDTRTGLPADLIAGLIGSVGTPSFGAAFFAFARSMFGISDCSAFAFAGSSPPRPIVLEGRDSKRRSVTRSLGSAYAAGGYRDDPHARRPFAADSVDVCMIGADELMDAGYRSYFFENHKIARKLAVVSFCGGKRYHVGFYRMESDEAFGEKELANARDLAPIFINALHRQSELCGLLPEAHVTDFAEAGGLDATRDHLAAIFVAEGHGLSPREAQICASIVLGYGTVAMSLNLGVSENTISTHRKRAYAKLKISSQNELFARYFATVTRLQAVIAPPGALALGEPATQYSPLPQ